MSLGYTRIDCVILRLFAVAFSYKKSNRELVYSENVTHFGFYLGRILLHLFWDEEQNA